MELNEQQIEEVYNIVEIARSTGKIKKGTNEVTKAIERGTAKLVVYAKDASPSEIVLHLEPLSKEKKTPCAGVPSKEELGTAAGLQVGAASIVVVDAGEAKDQLKKLTSQEAA